MRLRIPLLQAGMAYVKHVTTIRQLVEAAPEQRAGMLSDYVRSLSNASFLGFKALMISAISKEKTAQAKAVLESLVRNLDAVRAGQPPQLNAPAGSPGARSLESAIATPPPGNPGAVPGMSEDEAFIADAQLVDEHWWNKPNIEQKLSKLVDTLVSFDDVRYQQFLRHMRRLREETLKSIKEHEENEFKAWGSCIEDQAAYVLARRRTGERDARWVEGMRGRKSLLADIDWVITSCEKYWPIVQKRRQSLKNKSTASR